MPPHQQDDQRCPAGLILPIALGVMLIAAYRSKFIADYKQPLWLTIAA